MNASIPLSVLSASCLARFVAEMVLALGAGWADLPSISSQRSCPNAVPAVDVKRRFETLAARDYVGQQQAWNYVSGALERYSGLAPRATCADWTVHFSGPSGSGKSFLAEIVANAAFQEWEEEPYPLAEIGAAAGGAMACGSAAYAIGGLLGGPLGAGAAGAACALGVHKAWGALSELSSSMQRTFRATRPYPAQCGVINHKFSRKSTVEEVRTWEYRVAKSLLLDPRTIVVVDDIGRLKDAEAFEHFGNLLCGAGGSSIPEFRTGPGDTEVVPASGALFLLTSDLEMDAEFNELSEQLGSFDQMLDAVREQSSRFWAGRQLHMPDWWASLPLVPFRELNPAELTDVTKRYLKRQCEMAGRQVEAHLERQASFALYAQRVYRWTGTVKHGQESLNILDSYVFEATRAVGDSGRRGGWVIEDFHRNVMEPAIQALTAPHEHDGTSLVTSGGHGKPEVTWATNKTTIYYTSEVCLSITKSPGAKLPRARFELMKTMCH
jgi:hypothetical protein